MGEKRWLVHSPIFSFAKIFCDCRKEVTTPTQKPVDAYLRLADSFISAIFRLIVIRNKEVSVMAVITARKLAVSLLMISLCSCSTMSNKPTLERMALWFNKTKYVATLESAKSVEEVISLAKASPCQGKQIDSSGTAVVGPNAYAPISVTVIHRFDSGDLPDGGAWAALKHDAFGSHDVVMAFKAFPTPSGSRIEVAPVKSGVAEQLKQSIEKGQLFCQWQLFSDPWRK